jgi:thiosulfate dehydrogenase [quinone] large subunit
VDVRLLLNPQIIEENETSMSANAAVRTLVPLRLFLGLTFVYAAVDKIADPGYLDPHAGGAYLGNQLAGFVEGSPIGFLIQSVVLPQIQLVGRGIVATELVVGLLVLGGILTRPAAALGALLNLSLFLSLTWNIQPYFLAPDSLYAVAWITLAMVGDGGVLSLESLIPRRWTRFDRALDRVQSVLVSAGLAAVSMIWILAILPKPA